MPSRWPIVCSIISFGRSKILVAYPCAASARIAISRTFLADLTRNMWYRRGLLWEGLVVLVVGERNLWYSRVKEAQVMGYNAIISFQKPDVGLELVVTKA